MNVNPEVLITLLGGGGVAGILGAIITGITNKRRLGAEATEIITKAASGVVERVEAENTRLRARVDECEAEIEAVRNAHDRDREEWSAIVAEHTRILQLHAAWDALAVAKLREAGFDGLPMPPAMYPQNATPAGVRGTLGLDA